MATNVKINVKIKCENSKTKKYKLCQMKKIPFVVIEIQLFKRMSSRMLHHDIFNFIVQCDFLKLIILIFL